jgi:hypothetical protein
LEQLGLPASAVRRIIGRGTVFVGIVSVRNLKIESRPQGDLLGVGVSLATIGGFESVYHTSILLRKAKSDQEWDKSRVYHLNSDSIFSFNELFALPWGKIWSHVVEVR